MHASFPCERCHTNGLDAPRRACVTCHGTHDGSVTDCAKVYCSCHGGNVPSGD